MTKLVYAGAAVAAAILAILWLNTGHDDSQLITPESTGSQSTLEDRTMPAAEVAARQPARETGDPARRPATDSVLVSEVGAEPRASVPADEAQPIDVSPGFEFLAKPESEMKDTDFQWTSWRRHQKLQAESRDPNWAARIESEIRNGIQAELTANGYDTQRIEMPVVECRMTGCEIQALGYVQDNRRKGVDFQQIFPRLLLGKLGEEFDLTQTGMQVRGRPDARMTFLVQLSRKKP